MADIKRLISLGSLYSLGSIAQSAIGFFLLPVYSLFLKPADFGVISLISISVSLITILIDSPVTIALNRYFYHSSYQEDRPKFVFTLFLFSLFQALSFSFLFYLLSKPLCMLIFGDTVWLNLLHIYSILIFLTPVANFFQALLRIGEKAVYYIIVNVTSALLVFTLVVYLLKHDYGVYSIAAGAIFNAIFVVTTVSFFFVSVIKPGFSLQLLKKPLTFSYPFLLADYSQILFDSGDRYLLKLFVSVKEIGIYDIGYRLAGMYNVVLGAPIGQSISPLIMKEEGNPDKIRFFLKKYTTYYYLIGMFVALAVSLFAKELVAIVMVNNQDFVESWKIIPLVLFGNVLHGLGYFIGWGIILKEKSWTSSIIMIVALVANILFNLLLIPIFGLNGAALATLLSYIVWSVLKMYYSARYYQLYFQIKKMIIITIVSILLYSIGISFASSDSIIANSILKIIICSIYVALFWYSSFFNKDEKSVFKNLGKIIFNRFKSSIK